MTKKSTRERQSDKIRFVTPGILAGIALLFFIVAVVLFSRYGEAAYYAHYGKPLHFGSSSQAKVQAESIPHFDVTGTVSSTTVSAGDTQKVTVTFKSDQSTSPQVKVWIKNPAHNKEVWKSPKKVTMQFPAGKTVTVPYTYLIPATIPSGSYKIGVILTSTDDYTDYFVNEDLAGFTVQ